MFVESLCILHKNTGYYCSSVSGLILTFHHISGSCSSFCTFRCQINASSLLIFRSVSNLPDLIRTPFINFKEIDFFTNSLLHFFSWLVLFTPNFQGKIACFCIYFSFMLYDNLLLFFPSLYNHLKPFLILRPLPVIKARNFSRTSLFIRTPHLLGP